MKQWRSTSLNRSKTDNKLTFLSELCGEVRYMCSFGVYADTLRLPSLPPSLSVRPSVRPPAFGLGRVIKIEIKKIPTPRPPALGLGRVFKDGGREGQSVCAVDDLTVFSPSKYVFRRGKGQS